MTEQYKISVTNIDELSKEFVFYSKKEYMDKIYEVVEQGGYWMRDQTTYFALVNHYSPLFAADDYVTISASYND